MIRVVKWTIALVPLLAAASSAAPPGVGQAKDSALYEARADAWRAEAEAVRLSEAATRARGEAARLAAERLAAAAAISAAEARLSEAGALLARRQAAVRNAEAQLAERQAPVASLIAALVNLGRRPPLISIADRHGLDDLVRMRLILDVAVPHVRTRSAALSADLQSAVRLAGEARSAARSLVSAGAELRLRQQRFAELESRSIGRAAALDAGTLGADDRVVVAREGAATIGNQRDQERAARKLISELALVPAAPPRPFRPDSPAPPPPFAFILPVDAPVSDGLGAISANGIRSRGTTFETRAGEPVLVPADGVLVFAGPFRRHDGIAVIDHGGGWMSLLIGVKVTVAKGDRVKRAAPLGRGLGRVTLEVSSDGRPVSAIGLAGASQSLSIKMIGG